MDKGTFIFVVSSIIFSSSFVISAMDNTEMIEIVKGGQKILIPLVEVAKKITPLIPTQQAIQKSNSLLSSTYNLMMAYPQQTCMALGYATFFGGIVYYANSKRRIITNSGLQKLQNEQKEALDVIAQEEATIISDIHDATRTFVLSRMQKRLQESKRNYRQVQALGNSVKKNFALVGAAEAINHQLLAQKQERCFTSIQQNSKATQEERSTYFKQKTEETEQSINTHFTEFYNTSKSTRENILSSINSFHDDMQQYQDRNKALDATEQAHLDALSNSLALVKQSSTFLEEVVSQLDQGETVNMDYLSALSEQLDEQKSALLAIENNLLQENHRSPAVMFLPLEYN